MTLTIIDIIAICAAFLFVILFLAYELEWPAAAVVVATVAYLTYMTQVPVKEFFHRPDWVSTALWWTLEYIVAGLAFSVIKWVQYSRRQADRYRSDQLEWEQKQRSDILSLRNQLDRLNTELNNERALAQAKSVTLDESDYVKRLEALAQQLKERSAQTFLGTRSEFYRGDFIARRSYGAITVSQLYDHPTKTDVDMSMVLRLVTKWAAWWPAYAVLFIISDALYEVWQFISRVFTSVFSTLFTRIARIFFRT